MSTLDPRLRPPRVPFSTLLHSRLSVLSPHSPPSVPVQAVQPSPSMQSVPHTHPWAPTFRPAHWHKHSLPLGKGEVHIISSGFGGQYVIDPYEIRVITEADWVKAINRDQKIYDEVVAEMEEYYRTAPPSPWVQWILKTVHSLAGDGDSSTTCAAGDSW
ncbi:hypothetical protein CALVIDRAFT_536126 [Calocera viscosa TUFC12733]|uniref:Uncharacterized protein n=1 Tax=Calocera viscosa (strain TUFC12733) TaxID=1330018 RepID=A0A167NBB2_CALVF|nr:hypothetical protein CALVIDRAFT_536126 [Calocera viscosa TUFC12733]